MSDASEALETFLEHVSARNPHEPEFLQAVREVAESVFPVMSDQDRQARLLERLVEPERTVIFRVPWVDDDGEVHVERGFRVQLSSALGPYKGGLRFHPSVNLSILKFLAFEQAFKNALTGLPLGAGKGGATFDPRGRSDVEIMRFCQSFMCELYRHLGPTTDVPAGDIGVGTREIGFLFGQYKRLSVTFDGSVTGKGPGWGGSRLRTEATGYGVIYFARAMLGAQERSLSRRTVAISGAGNVALYAAEQAICHEAQVITLSDSGGFIHKPGGLDTEQLEWIKALKFERRGRIYEAAEKFDDITYHEGAAPWGVPADLALPCATQNELDADHARALIDNGCVGVIEGANMPCTPEAIDAFHQASIAFGPGKAANAGGVATSAFEMSQNAQHTRWTRHQVDEKLAALMQRIHDRCAEHAGKGDVIDYARGANISAFLRIAKALRAQGVV